ncbi:energy transducer TonB [uncultured Polaribacter sp.]|uniref:energy transducer TonB n=1 Tax=uncultured Polaribacter sp. TaxID=174711 RepID=UPI002607F7E2|nr:energy transducer TonB [uncultured Polaribacter sp.]
MDILIRLTTLFLVVFSAFGQTNSYYKAGDTLYYQNNRATYLKTNTLIIIKQTNVAKNRNTFNVEKHVLDSISNTYILNARFITNGLQQLKANGTFTSYHKNGNISAVGETVNGKIGNGIWTHYYENGEKKSEEKLSKETFFNDQKVNLVVNFWDKKGIQTVENSNGFIQSISNENGDTIKGNYKDGLKNGLWTAFDGATKVYEETYKKGQIIKGTCWDAEGNAMKYKSVFTKAYYKKPGNGNVEKFIAKKFDASSAGIIGNILITFIVTKEGNIENVAVLKGLTQDYNAEIKRIISEMSNWTPAKKRGKSLQSVYNLNLNFKG